MRLFKAAILAGTVAIMAAGSAFAADVKIGFIVKQPEEPWFQDEWKFAEQAGKEKGFTVVKIGAEDGEKVQSAIDTFLRTLGFVPHCFVEMKIRPLAPMVLDGDPSKGVRQLLEADVVYVRDFATPQSMDGEQWKHLALVAHHCYDSVDLALRAITAAMRHGAVPPGTPERYLKLLASLRISAGIVPPI